MSFVGRDRLVEALSDNSRLVLTKWENIASYCENYLMHCYPSQALQLGA